MTNNRIWIIACLLMSGLVLAGTWFLGVSPTLAIAAMADTARADAEAQNTVHQRTLADLTTRFASIGDLKASLAEASKSIPADAAMPSFLDSLNGAATQTGAFVTSIGTADATYYLGEVVAEVPAETTEDDAQTTNSEQSDAPTVEGDTPADEVPLPGALPVIAGAELLQSGNFSVLPVTVTSTGTLDQVLAFVDALQKGERLFSVGSLDLAEDMNTGGFEVNVAGFVYVLAEGASAPTAVNSSGISASTATG